MRPLRSSGVTATSTPASSPAGIPPAGTRLARLVAVVIPLGLLAVGAWSRRWTSDDGFINLRIVEQLWAGNGPVWNATERVETGTSPLWLAVLTVVGAVVRFVAVEWVSVALGIACTIGGLAAGTAAARLLHRPTDRLLVPVGALVVAALPPFWDFASSGLETGLSFLWLGLCGWALAAAASTVDDTGRRAAATGALLGLGPLVRPDLALISVTTLLALLVLHGWPGWRRSALVVAAAGALPVAYQLFRMAYFAALVPNTAFAKEGSASRWDVGWSYAGDFTGTWRLWWPALAVVVVATVALGPRARTVDRPGLVVVAGLTAGAALHALYVIRVGGDFMHARLLLPATFTALVPWASVPLRRATAAAGALLLPWAVLAATSWEPAGRSQAGGGPAEGIVDERSYYVSTTRPNPVTAADFAGGRYAEGGRRAAAVADEGRGALTLRTFTPEDEDTWSPLRDPAAPFAVWVDNIGIFGFLAGPDVTVIDARGLGDPVTSRFRLAERGRPGHEKAASPAWVVGRHGAPGSSPPEQEVDPAAIAAARDAVACGELAEVLDAVTGRLTPSRAATNIVLSLRSYGLRFSANPFAAREELCGP